MTRDLAPKAEEVIDIVQRDNPEVHLEKEFLQNTVELVTGVHDTVPQAVAELAHDPVHVRLVRGSERLRGKTVAVLLPVVYAQSQVWGQCEYTKYYLQCLGPLTIYL